MLYKLIAGFIFALVIIFLIDIYRKRHKKVQEQSQETDSGKHSDCGKTEGCCGKHENCEKLDLLARIKQEIVYYDDEELDVYKNRATDSYSKAEINEFREVLNTMQPDDISGWLESLERRNIRLPDELQDAIDLNS